MKTAPDIPISDVRAELNGKVITDDDPGYDDARRVVFTGLDRRPAAIVRVDDAADVARVVKLARETGAELAVRSGGHSRAGHGTSEGGIVLDLAAMNAVEIDADGRTAWAQTGITTGDYTRATGEHGLATGFGDSPTVGLGGITLGGGVGFLTRRRGLTIDDLLAAEVVTADGELARDQRTGPRGRRGPGGALRDREHHQGSADAVPPRGGARQARRDRPDGLRGGCRGGGAGDRADSWPGDAGRRYGTADPLPGDVRRTGGHAAGVRRGDEYPRRWATRGSGEAIVEHLHASSAPMAAVQLRVLGGAMRRVPEDATAFAYRKANLLMNFAAM